MNFIKITKDELCHFGVPGMKWGHRKSETPGVSGHVDRMAKRDAKRHADAKMFYGETAGTKRKLLKAELDRKKARIPGYEDAFNKHLENVNYAASAKKAIRKRRTIDTTEKAREATQQILGITGSLTVAAGSALYYRNKPQVDAFIYRQLQKLSSKIGIGR